MIDTVIMRIHNLRKYQIFLKRLENETTRMRSDVFSIMDKSTVQKLRKTGRSEEEISQIMILHKTGQHIKRREVFKRQNRSNHYDLAYLLDHERDFVEFNFSIPKYKFGTNILMDVEHERDQYWRYADCREFKHNVKRCVERFFLFIKDFLRKEFVFDDINLHDVEIYRIDVCFNQVFKPGEALPFFNYQRMAKKKYRREEDKGRMDYATSFMHASKRSTSKIYYKGSEYRQNDKKEHLRINSEKGYPYFDIARLEELASRTLRYELTIRNAELNYMFKHNIFRRDCSYFKMEYKDYLNTSKKVQRNDEIAKKVVGMSEAQKEAYLKFTPYQVISSDDRKIYKQVSKLLERQPRFMLATSADTKAYNQRTVNYKCELAEFTPELLTLCFQKLENYINEFQIRELPDEEKVSLKIDEYNKANSRKMLKTGMMQFYGWLVRYGSFSEVRKRSIYPDITFKRYKARFKKIGITERHIQPDTPFSMPIASKDLKGYHDFLFENRHLLNTKMPNL
jgi:hypothetical protein